MRARDRKNVVYVQHAKSSETMSALIQFERLWWRFSALQIIDKGFFKIKYRLAFLLFSYTVQGL